MNKLYLILMLLLLGTTNSNAQESCDCVQHEGNAGTQTIQVICNYSSLLQPDPVPCVFIIFSTETFYCPDGSSYTNRVSPVVVDNRIFWESQYGPNTGISCDFDESKIDYWVKLYSGGSYTRAFKVGCQSVLKLRWPNGTYIIENLGGDGIPPALDTIQFNETFFYVYLPCEEQACCQIFYKEKSIRTANGETEVMLVPDGFGGNTSCSENKPNPDDFVNSMQGATIINTDGSTQIVKPVIVSQGLCKSICSPEASGYFITGLDSQKKLLELSANPTLVSDKITFESNQPIKNVTIFDMAGKKIIDKKNIELNSLDLTELKIGQYYVQVQLTNDVVKTIKIMKQ